MLGLIPALALQAGQPQIVVPERPRLTVPARPRIITPSDHERAHFDPSLAMLPGLGGAIAGAGSSAAAITDPFFSNVVLLVGFDGTSGATTFTDESPSAHVLTPHGNVQVDTSILKFGTGSGKFDGTGDWIQTPDSADWDFGTGPFTVELWGRQLVKGTSQAFLGQWDNAGTVSNCAWYLFITSGLNQFTLRMSNGSSNIDCNVNTAGGTGAWSHYAADRDGTGKTRIYINGLRVGSSTSQTFAPPNSTASLVIGAIGLTSAFSSNDYNGNMDELRITKGVARYATDTSFTAPTAAFPRS